MHAGTRRVTRWDERRAGMKKGGGGGGETLRTKRKNVKRKRRIAQQRWRFDLLLAPSRETVRGWLSVRMSIFGTSEPKFLLNEPDRKETLVLSPAAGRRLLSVRPESPLSSSVHLFNLKTLSVPAACGSPPLPHQVSERVRGHEGAALSHCKQSKPHSSWTVKTISVTNMSELLCPAARSQSAEWTGEFEGCLETSWQAIGWSIRTEQKYVTEGKTIRVNTQQLKTVLPYIRKPIIVMAKARPRARAPASAGLWLTLNTRRRKTEPAAFSTNFSLRSSSNIQLQETNKAIF